MYYNSGDRQNSLSLIAILITRLNTKAAIPYSLTCHHPHPELRGTPPATALLTQTPGLHVQLMFMHVANLHPSGTDNTLAHPTPRAGTPSWDHTSLGPPPGSSKEMLSLSWGKLPLTPGMLCWRCLLTGCKQKAPSFQSPTPKKSPLSHPSCLDIPRHKGFCPEDAAKALHLWLQDPGGANHWPESQSLLFSSEDVLCGDLQLPARRNKPLEKT